MYHFPFVLRKSAFLLEQVCREWILLVFLYLTVSLFYFSLIKVVLTGYRILGWGLFSLRALKNIFIPFGFQNFWWEIYIIQIIIILFPHKYHQSLSAYKIVSLPLCFSSFIMICVGMDFFGFTLLGVWCAFRIFRFMPLSKFRKFLVISHYFCKYFLLQWTISHLLLGFHDIIPCGDPWGFIPFFYIFFLLFLLGLDTFYWFIFKFTHIFLCHLHFAIDFIQ